MISFEFSAEDVTDMEEKGFSIEAAAEFGYGVFFMELFREE